MGLSTKRGGESCEVMDIFSVCCFVFQNIIAFLSSSSIFTRKKKNPHVFVLFFFFFFPV